MVLPVALEFAGRLLGRVGGGASLLESSEHAPAATVESIERRQGGDRRDERNAASRSRESSLIPCMTSLFPSYY